MVKTKGRSVVKELFLDSADVNEITRLLGTDAIQGVTTNPSLMAKQEKGDYTQRLVNICEAFQWFCGNARKHLSVEVISTDPKTMYHQAHTLLDQLRHFDKVDLHVKIPFMFETLETITKLSDEGFKVNATAIVTTLQAKMAHDAGARIVSFFWCRGRSAGEEMELEVGRFAKGLNRNTRIIAGSIREPMDVYHAWMAGADIVTAPYSVIQQMTRHKVTDDSIAGFQRDIEAWLK